MPHVDPAARPTSMTQALQSPEVDLASATMQAAIFTAYGPPEVVEIREVPLPRPRPSEVLVRIAAASVSSADWRIRAHAMPTGFGLLSRLVFGISRPRQPILGSEFCGTIAAVGERVTRWKVGEPVIGFAGVGLASHAAFRVMPEDGNLVPMPRSLTTREAAAFAFGGTTALYYLRDLGRLAPGEKVLVIGASGAVGSAAVQLARHFGADVTAVTSGANRDLALSLGASAALDYTREDFTKRGPHYDIILDTVGAETFARAKSALRPEGRFLMVAASLPQMLAALATILTRQKAVAGVAPEKRDDLVLLASLAEAGAYRPVIDSVFPFTAIAEAHRRVETHRKRGNVVVEMAAGHVGGHGA